MTLDGSTARGVVHLDLAGAPLSADLLALLHQEHHEFEAVLGVPVVFSAPSQPCSLWKVERAAADEQPSLCWDPATSTLTSRGHGEDGLLQTFGLL